MLNYSGQNLVFPLILTKFLNFLEEKLIFLFCISIFLLILGMLTTPQLHFIVRCVNSDRKYGKPSEEGYYTKLSNAFNRLMSQVLSIFHICASPARTRPTRATMGTPSFNRINKHKLPYITKICQEKKIIMTTFFDLNIDTELNSFASRI